MGGLLMVVAVAKRGDGERCLRAFQHCGAYLTTVSAGEGTATNEMLSILGLTDTEKDVLFSIVAEARLQETLLRLATGAQTVAFAVPLASIARNVQPDEDKERADRMSKEIKHEVVVVVADRGYVDLMMDAARAAGATGGTAIHARGTGDHESGKFFGVSIAEEKEMTFMVVSQAVRTPVMRAVLTALNQHMKSKPVVFSLPIQSLMGFRDMIDGD